MLIVLFLAKVMIILEIPLYGGYLFVFFNIVSSNLKTVKPV